MKTIFCGASLVWLLIPFAKYALAKSPNHIISILGSPCYSVAAIILNSSIYFKNVHQFNLSLPIKGLRFNSLHFQISWKNSW